DLLGANATAEERMTVLVGLWRVKLHRGDLLAALGLIRQCQALPFRRRQPEMSAHINRLLGMTLLYIGEFEQARAHLERAIDVYGEARSDASISDVSALTVFGADHAFSMLAFALWVLGYPDRALDAAKRAESCAMQVGHAVSIGVAKVHSSFLRGELVGDASL